LQYKLYAAAKGYIIFEHGGVLRRAREEISLGPLEISASKIRQAATGDLLLEIPGPGEASKIELSSCGSSSETV